MVWFRPTSWTRDRSALSDALEHWTDRRVTPVNARLVADENALAITNIGDDTDPARPSSLSRSTAVTHTG